VFFSKRITALAGGYHYGNVVVKDNGIAPSDARPIQAISKFSNTGRRRVGLLASTGQGWSKVGASQASILGRVRGCPWQAILIAKRPLSARPRRSWQSS